MGMYYLYAGTLLLIANLDIIVDRNKKTLLFLSSFIVLIFIGLRYELGVDWLFYRDFYNGGTITLTVEPGYQLLSLAFHQTGASFWFFTFLITLLSVISLNYIFKNYSPYPAFLSSIYFIISFGFNIEALRQILAVACFYIALRAYFKRKEINYYILCGTGALFHISALLLLFIPFFIKRSFIKLGLYSLIFGLVLGLIGIYPVGEFIKIVGSIYSNPYIDKLIWYSSTGAIGSILTFNLIFKLLLYVFFIKSKKNIIMLFSVKNIPLIYLKTFESIFLLMLNIDVFLGQFGTISSRLDEYFLPSMLIIMTYVIAANAKKGNRILLSCLFSTYILISFSRFISNDYFAVQFVPYSNSVLQSLNESQNDIVRENAVKSHWQMRK